MPQAKLVPAVADAVVFDGVKYRIRAIEAVADGPQAASSVAGPAWRRTPVVAWFHAADMRWDNIAGVWRLKP